MITNELTDLCIVCKKKADVKCSGCNRILYCTSKHLKEHSAIHKPECKPFTIASNKQLGRFLVASRNIRQGEIVFQEKPLVVGPGENTLSSICFSCGGICSDRCPVCRVALICGQECPGKGHSNLECDLYKKASKKLHNTNFLNNHLILPLRCLINLQTPVDQWNKFFDLESHNEKRRGTCIWELHHKTVVQVLQKWGLISKSTQDEDRIQTIMGIIDVNSFEVRCGIDSQGRALYPEAALMTHDCFPNCIVAVDNHFIMTVKARKDIPAGQILTYNYTNALHGTATRKSHLLETKYFICDCSRCKDPTELGTHMSSLVCPRCRIGLITYHSEKKLWICNQCSHEFSKGLISTTLYHVKCILEDLDKNNYREVENTITKLSKTLASNHSYIIDLKQQLAVLYRDQEPNVKVLDKRKKICEDLVSIISILEPGISRLRGIALYELQNVFKSLAELKQNDLILLCEAEKILKEAVSILLHEPSSSPEGNLARKALSELKYLRDSIQHINKTKNKKKNK